ncbi:hypothetical protein KP509_30G073200 [Ceratopteris richardii]|nr:hypothetical protein KP509_30G073200 [Ceratopteris richardii]
MAKSSLEDLDGSSGEPVPLTGACSPIDPSTARFPCCIVWTPLPLIAWLAPYVGHVGICREDGVILDFAGPYIINVDNFAFGATARYVQLMECSFSSQLGSAITNSNHDTGLSWNDAIRNTMQQFQHTSYNLFTCNCHSFVAACLNKLGFRGSNSWNVIKIVILVLFEGQWVNRGAIVKSFAPFIAVMLIGMYMASWSFLIGWGVFNLLLIGWFLMGTYLLHGFIKC